MPPQRDRQRARLDDLSDDEAIAWLWRQGRLAALVGGSIGFGVCVVLGVGLTALLALLPGAGGTRLTSGDLVPLIVRAAGLVALGAAIGLLITGIRFTVRLSAVLGQDVRGKQIRRAIFRGDPTPLSRDEQVRATRYAPLGEASIRFQIIDTGVLYVGILLQQVPQLLLDPADAGIDLRPLTLVLVILLVGVYAVLLPVQLRNIRRAHRYADTHAHLGGPA